MTTSSISSTRRPIADGALRNVGPCRRSARGRPVCGITLLAFEQPPARQPELGGDPSGDHLGLVEAAW